MHEASEAPESSRTTPLRSLRAALFDRHCAWLVALALGASVLFTIGDFGITWDEPVRYFAGVMHGMWFRDLSLSRIDYYWQPGLDQPPMGTILGGFARYLVFRKLGLMNDLTACRVQSAFFVFALTFALFSLLRPAFGRGVALLAAVATFCLPRVFFAANLYALDYPVTAACVAAAWAFWKGLENPALDAGRRRADRPRAAYEGERVLPVPDAVRLVRNAAPAELGRAGPAARDRRRACVAERLARADLAAAARVRAGLAVALAAPDLPPDGLLPAPIRPCGDRHVLHGPASAAMTLPLRHDAAHSAAGDLAADAGGNRARAVRSAPRAEALPAAERAGAAGGAGVAHFVPVDGVRLFLPAFPFLCALSAVGTGEIAGMIRRRSLRLVFAGAYACLFLVTVWFSLVRYHPHQASYYNELIGGVRGATRAGSRRRTGATGSGTPSTG